MATDSPEGAAPQRSALRRPRSIIAVGGGRGGVGKTLLALNMAVYLAQLGRKVALCDADPNGSNLHSALGHDRPPLALPEAILDGTAGLVPTNVPGLDLMPTAYDPWSVAPKRPSRRSYWISALQRLEVDYAVLNLGASVSAATLDLFREADIGVCVAAPEPAAIEATYRFCRALFARGLRRMFMRERFRLRAVERALASLPPLPTPRQLVAEIARYDESVANLAAAAMLALRPGLVIGKTRLRRDLELGPAMSSLSERYLGIRMDYLGYVEQDDAVWLTARRRRPLLIDGPTAKSARNLEKVARRILAALTQKHKVARALTPVDANALGAPLTLYQVLGVPRTAGDEEIRRAYKMQREIFREGSLPIVSLVDEEGMRRELARITEAYDTLLDPARRRSYDLSVFVDEEQRPAEAAAEPNASEVELAELQAELAREVTPETQFTGALLAKCRRAQGIGLGEIATITKIAPGHLRAIETEDFPALPAQVYVRGFLQMLARSLKLDPTQVTKTYLKRVRAAREDYR